MHSAAELWTHRSAAGGINQRAEQSAPGLIQSPLRQNAAIRTTGARVFTPPLRPRDLLAPETLGEADVERYGGESVFLQIRREARKMAALLFLRRRQKRGIKLRNFSLDTKHVIHSFIHVLMSEDSSGEMVTTLKSLFLSLFMSFSGEKYILVVIVYSVFITASWDFCDIFYCILICCVRNS